MNKITIPEAVRQMLEIVQRLASAYPHKKFTLDGRLVGDIGEILAEEAYDIQLFEDLTKHHDGTCSDGRLVQVKATMKNQLTFPSDHIPKYYLGIKIFPDGTFKEIFNGPGEVAWQAVRDRKPAKNNLHCISLFALEKLQKTVLPEDRIRLRSNNTSVRTKS